MLEIIEVSKHIYELKVPDCIPRYPDFIPKLNILEKIKKILSKRKEKKKKGRKKGKKKKK